MSTSLGRIVINTRERAVSTDINRLQDLLGQDLGEVLRGISGVPDYPPAVAPENRNCVLRGLTCSPGAGMSVDVAEGHALVVRGAGAPSADDSAYRLLHCRATTNAAVAAADPANDRWDLVEATFADDITESPLRDIYDPVTGTFAPAAVTKVRRAGATIQVTTGIAGANPAVPAFTGGDWIPIAAVRVPALAAALVQDDVCDMRPLWVPAPLSRCHAVVDGFELSAVSLSVASSAIYVGPGRAVVDGQLVKRTLAQTVTIADHMDPSFAAAPNQWVYAYLFACRDGTGSRPRITAPGSPTREGYVVITNVAPTVDGRPSAAVTFPNAGGASNSLFTGSTSTRGLYLGAFKLAALATQAQPFLRENGWVTVDQLALGDVAFTYVASGAAIAVSLAGGNLTPGSCRAARVRLVLSVVANAAAPIHQATVRTTGSVGEFDHHDVVQTIPVIPHTPVTGPAVVALGAARTFEVVLTAGAPDRWDPAALAHAVALDAVFDPVPRLHP